MNDAQLIEAATRARAHAYAPYSHFRVGAAALSRAGTIYTGVNVESCSFGLTVCAERNSIAAAVLDGVQPGDIIALAISADAATPTVPCGACRQVIAEFAPPEARIILHNVRDDQTETHRLDALLPNAFTRSSMPRL